MAPRKKKSTALALTSAKPVAGADTAEALEAYHRLVPAEIKQDIMNALTAQSSVHTQKDIRELMQKVVGYAAIGQIPTANLPYINQLLLNMMASIHSESVERRERAMASRIEDAVEVNPNKVGHAAMIRPKLKLK